MQMEKVKAEFHVHTRYSKDSILNKYFILIMCILKKIKIIAITDHNEIEGAIRYLPFFKKYNIDVIVGEEIMTKDGEIIGLFLKEKINPNLTANETIKKIKEQEGIVYVPHPYDEKRNKTVLKTQVIIDNSKNIDFIEIHNGRNIKKEYDIRQRSIQEQTGISPIVGSDAHTFFELGRNYIYVEYNSIECFKNNMKKIINIENFVERKCIGYSHYWTKMAKLIKMVERKDYNGIHRIIARKLKRQV